VCNANYVSIAAGDNRQEKMLTTAGSETSLLKPFGMGQENTELPETLPEKTKHKQKQREIDRKRTMRT
jgi:hypothetical protein